IYYHYGFPEEASWTMMYDRLMRLPFFSWVVGAAALQTAGLFQFVNITPVDAVSAVHIAMRFSTLGFMLLLAMTVLLRTRPSAKASGLEPRISALLGTFLMYGVAFFP